MDEASQFLKIDRKFVGRFAKMMANKTGRWPRRMDKKYEPFPLRDSFFVAEDSEKKY